MRMRPSLKINMGVSQDQGYLFWGLYWGPPILGNFHMVQRIGSPFQCGAPGFLFAREMFDFKRGGHVDSS